MKIPSDIPDFLFSFRLTPRRSLIAASVVAALTFVTVKCGISQEDLLKFYNEIRKSIKFDLPDQKHITNEIDNQLNERINRNQKLLEYKIKREVDDAVFRYQRLTGDDGTVRISSPQYSEKSIDPILQTGESRLLGGEMRLCAPWVDDCPKD